MTARRARHGPPAEAVAQVLSSTRQGVRAFLMPLLLPEVRTRRGGWEHRPANSPACASVLLRVPGFALCFGRPTPIPLTHAV